MEIKNNAVGIVKEYDSFAIFSSKEYAEEYRLSLIELRKQSCERFISDFVIEVLAGIRMPSIICLTWYKDKPTRNAVWEEFVKHPDWLRIREMKEYVYTATDNKNRLLSPLSYSQF
ncbi:MAG: NIPSNAP family protein [Prevotellaceae bacterium]|jgi:hypothetical protein|nr:NIPSNAP family protein [Prevotellaceae bacterium]